MFAVSLPIHRHHESYGTILIAPHVLESEVITKEIMQDNAAREARVRIGEGDPGRSDTIDWFKVKILCEVICVCD